MGGVCLPCVMECVCVSAVFVCVVCHVCDVVLFSVLCMCVRRECVYNVLCVHCRSAKCLVCLVRLWRLCVYLMCTGCLHL